ncbi:hypothetical protein ACJJTC_013505 [Scirpophaga incertulas]
MVGRDETRQTIPPIVYKTPVHAAVYKGSRAQAIYKKYGLENDPESINNVCLLLLTYIINITPARKKKGKEIIKFSRSEMSCAFIHQVASVSCNIINPRTQGIIGQAATVNATLCHICRGQLYSNKNIVCYNQRHCLQFFETHYSCRLRIQNISLNWGVPPRGV